MMEKEIAFGNIQDIHFGFATIPYTEEIRMYSGKVIKPEGWVAPGGGRITIQHDAEVLAERIHNLMVSNGYSNVLRQL